MTANSSSDPIYLLLQLQLMLRPCLVPEQCVVCLRSTSRLFHQGTLDKESPVTSRALRPRSDELGANAIVQACSRASDGGCSGYQLSDDSNACQGGSSRCSQPLWV